MDFYIIALCGCIHFFFFALQVRERIPMCMNGKRKAEMLHEKHLNGNNNQNKKKKWCALIITFLQQKVSSNEMSRA